ncbi:MAG: hypothetical protein QM758_06485 [Armatimonas sp.]
MTFPGNPKQRLFWLSAIAPGIVALPILFLNRVRAPQQTAISPPKATPAPTPLATEFDKAYSSIPLFQTIRRGDPIGYERFLHQLESQPYTDKEGGAALRKFVSEYIRNRARTASKATLIALQRRRLESYRQSMGISPDYAYAQIRRLPYDMASDKKHTWLASEYLRTQTDLASIVTAPPGNPLPYSEARAQRNFRKMLERFPPKHARALARPREATVKTKAEKIRYCQAFLYFYEAVLKLPEEEAIELFRHVDELPADSRV